jgi:hypothetical protein
MHDKQERPPTNARDHWQTLAKEFVPSAAGSAIMQDVVEALVDQSTLEKMLLELKPMFVASPDGASSAAQPPGVPPGQ